jgi:hypothetical protein
MDVLHKFRFPQFKKRNREDISDGSEGTKTKNQLRRFESSQNMIEVITTKA